MNNLANIVNIEERRPVVKADVDKGFDRTAHTINDYLCQCNIAGREFRVIVAIIAKTYRYHKKTDWISNSQIADKTGIDESNISRIKTSLINKNILIQDGRKVGINPVVSEWDLNKEKSKTTKNNLDKVSQKRLDPSQKRLTEKSKTTKKLVKNDLHIRKTNNTKETNTKDYSAPRKKNNTSLPDNFEVTKEMFDWAKKTGVTCNIKFETDQFIDYHTAKDSKFANWKLAWQTWMRNSIKFSKNQHTQKSKANQEDFAKKDYGTAMVNF